MRIAVLAGGRSSEHEISLASGEAVRAGLARAGHEVLDVRIARDGAWSCDGEALSVRPGGGLLDVEVAFPILHGPYGEDGTVQGMLEVLDVPYVGAGVLASAVCMDKLVFKQVMAAAGLPQVEHAGVEDARWRAARDAELARLAALGLPVFVKPVALGSSVGIVKVSTPQELGPALDQAFEHDARAIVEAMSPGLEVECAVMGDREPEASVPGEITIHAEWYDYEAKYTPGGMELVVPARVPEAVRERVRGLAVDTFRLVGCGGLARVDFFVEGDDVLVNELNTMPGFTPTSVFGKLFEASGVPYEALLERLADLARERHARERAYRH
ncbi:MAG TPA: D-alanine--D-alanine ligase family protein [Solirubrobacteraceae bacterium]|nr:D-alanine--D-alanine ligase family protein [Solirubrobacteraceae bacterium]